MFTLLAVAAILVVLVVVIISRPEDFSITRSTTMSVAPQAVFPQVNDLHNWSAWSPWAKLDPNMKMTFAGPEAGTGATYTWTGNGKVGEGRMTIVESRANELVKIRLEFMKPFTATNASEFAFQPQGNQTAVTWSMTGKRNFMMKAMSLVMNMDKMLGGQFEQGLAQMKAIAEAGR
jgi:Polyketide cyclase / dehydrase and lipid transport